MRTYNRGVSAGVGRHIFLGLNLPGAIKVITAISLVFLVGCKIVVEVPEGGQVVSDQDLVCSAGETCVIDVTDTNYLETFEAVAEPGYVFTQWKKSKFFLCGGSSQLCAIAASFLEGNPSMQALLDADFNLYLQPLFAPEDDRYDVAEWREFLQNLGSSNYTSNNFLYQVEPNQGNCDPGVLKPAATDRFLYAVNLIRKLHELPVVDYDEFYNAEMQQTNLVQQANDYFTHYPQPGDSCYTAAAASGAGSSNISWSSWQGDPARYALGWTNDSRNVASLMAAGHRRWMLYPDLGYTSYGQVSGYTSMKVFGFGKQPDYELPDDLEYVAFPYKNYPYIMVEKGSNPTPWSLSVVPASGSGRSEYFASATIRVKEVGTGRTLNVHSKHTDTSGYGLPNFLSWMVDNWENDTEYLVTISNVRMPDGSVTTIEYPVEIDYAEFQ